MTISRRSFVAAAIAAIAGGAAAVAAPVAIAALPARKKITPEAADKVGRWLRETFYVKGRIVSQKEIDAAYAPRRFSTEEICKMFDVPVHMVEGIGGMRS